MKIQIALVVGDDGTFAATEVRNGDPDWGLILDSLGVWNGSKQVYPKIEKRYVVEVEVETPQAETITGTVEPA